MSKYIWGFSFSPQSVQWQSCAWWQSPKPQSAWMRQLFCTGSFLQTPMLMLHENFPGLHSWDVLSLCYKCISLAKIAKFGRSCLGRFFFYSYLTQVKSPGHSQIQSSHKLCGSASYNAFILACLNGLRGSGVCADSAAFVLVSVSPKVSG